MMLPSKHSLRITKLKDDIVEVFILNQNITCLKETLTEIFIAYASGSRSSLLLAFT